MDVRAAIAEVEAMGTFWGKEFMIGTPTDSVNVWGFAGSNGVKVAARVDSGDVSFTFDSGPNYRIVDIREVTNWLKQFV